MAAQVLIETAIETRSDGLDVPVELQATTDGRLLADVAGGLGPQRAAVYGAQQSPYHPYRRS